MQSTAKVVAAYLDEVPVDRNAALNKLRELCCTLLIGFEESMKYGGPCYSRNGQVEVGFVSQKHFIGLYILRLDEMNAHRKLLNVKGVSLGKGCIRYSKPEKIDFKVVEMLQRLCISPSGRSAATTPSKSAITIVQACLIRLINSPLIGIFMATFSIAIQFTLLVWWPLQT